MVLMRANQVKALRNSLAVVVVKRVAKVLREGLDKRYPTSKIWCMSITSNHSTNERLDNRIRTAVIGDEVRQLVKGAIVFGSFLNAEIREQSTQACVQGHNVALTKVTDLPKIASRGVARQKRDVAADILNIKLVAQGKTALSSLRSQVAVG